MKLRTVALSSPAGDGGVRWSAFSIRPRPNGWGWLDLVTALLRCTTRLQNFLSLRRFVERPILAAAGIPAGADLVAALLHRGAGPLPAAASQTAFQIRSRNRWLSPLFLLVASLATATHLAAQIQINLDGLASKAKESVEITLDSSMLKMAGNFLKSGKPDEAKVSDLISGLKAITVRNFEFDQEGQYRPEDVQSIRAQVRTPGWSKIVGVENKANRETSEIFAKTDQGKFVGFMILSAKPKELAVIYIEGTLDLAGLASLGGNFGIPPIAIPDQKKGKE